MTELVRTCDDHDIAAQPGACVRGGSLCLSFCPAGCCGAVCAAVYTNKTPDACSLLLLYCPLLLILIDSSPSALTLPLPPLLLLLVLLPPCLLLLTSVTLSETQSLSSVSLCPFATIPCL
jgi:hypothetical protein